MRLYMIRHGQTDWNKVKRLQGSSDILLNEQGEALAKVTGEGMKKIPLDLCFTSPLKRAVRTAELVCGGRDIPIIEESRIREISFGDYEGCIHGLNGYNIPDPDFNNFFRKPEAYHVPPNGESLQELLRRTGDFLREITQEESLKDKNILIATHGAALRALLSNMKGNEIKNFWEGAVHKNCAVSCVELVNGKYQILWENRIFYEEV